MSPLLILLIGSLSIDSEQENSLMWHTVVLNWINKYAGLPPYKEEKDQGFEVQSTPLMKDLSLR